MTKLAVAGLLDVRARRDGLLRHEKQAGRIAASVLRRICGAFVPSERARAAFAGNKVFRKSLCKH